MKIVRFSSCALAVVLACGAGGVLQAAGFELREISIRIPTETPGFVTTPGVPDEQQGIYHIEGWVNVPPRRTAVGKQPPDDGALLESLEQLLQAYRERDPEKFIALHRLQAQQGTAAKFDDPALREQWLGFVGTIEQIEPEIVWVAGEQLGSIVKLHRRDPDDGSVTKIVMPLVFDRNFRLFGEPLGPEQLALVSNLMWYFSREDVANEASALLVRDQAAR